MQTADSAAIGETTRLQIENPKEVDIVEGSFENSYSRGLTVEYLVHCR